VGGLTGAYGFKIMLFAAGVFYFIAMIMRLSMAREAAKTELKPTEKKFPSQLEEQYGFDVRFDLFRRLITWMLVTDGMRDISFQFSGNLFPCVHAGSWRAFAISRSAG
jgi:hypothetical protein